MIGFVIAASVNASLTHKLVIYIHQPGDEIWLYASTPLLNHVPSFEIPKIAGWTDIYFSQRILRHYSESGRASEKDGHCKDYAERSFFMSCVRKNILDILKSSATCWIPEYKDFLRQDEVNLPNCSGDGEGNIWV